MIRRFNYTGRRSIPQHAFEIRLITAPVRRFEALFDLSEYGIPADARLYLEAYSSGQTAVLRFPWGTAGAPTAPENTTLDSLRGESVMFNFKAVDESGAHGRILAVCRGIQLAGRTQGEAGRHPLLPVNAVPLDQQIWRLDFNQGTPWLEVNSAINDIKDRAQRDPAFFALVYPAVVRQLLAEIFMRRAVDLSDLGRWESRWLRWAIRFHPEKAEPPEGAEQQSDYGEWVDEVVKGFCSFFSVADRYARLISNGSVTE